MIPFLYKYKYVWVIPFLYKYVCVYVYYHSKTSNVLKAKLFILKLTHKKNQNLPDLQFCHDDNLRYYTMQVPQG